MNKSLDKLKCCSFNLKTDDETSVIYIGDWKKFASGGGLKKIDLALDESFRHLYFYSYRTVKPGDYFYSVLEGCVLFAKTKEEADKANNERDCYNNTHFKIEASTDKSLNLPLIDGDFLYEYSWMDGKIKHVYIEIDKKHNVVTDKKGFCIIDKDSIKGWYSGQIARNTMGYYPSINKNPRFYSDIKYQEGYLDAIETLVNENSELTKYLNFADPYKGDLNSERIKTYKRISEDYNVEEGTVRDIFSKGIDWYKSIIKRICNEQK